MANDLYIGSTLATYLIQCLADLFDSGTNTLKIYDDTDSIPADADAALGTNVLLVTITLPTPAFGTAAANVVAKTGTWAGTCVAAGTANFYRLATGAGGHVVQGTVGLTAGTFDLEASDIAWSISGTVTVDTFTLTHPEG